MSVLSKKTLEVGVAVDTSGSNLPNTIMFRTFYRILSSPSALGEPLCRALGFCGAANVYVQLTLRRNQQKRGKPCC